jgi:hypothetical protein
VCVVHQVPQERSRTSARNPTCNSQRHHYHLCAPLCVRCSAHPAAAECEALQAVVAELISKYGSIYALERKLVTWSTQSSQLPTDGGWAWYMSPLCVTHHVWGMGPLPLHVPGGAVAGAWHACTRWSLGGAMMQTLFCPLLDISMLE